MAITRVRGEFFSAEHSAKLRDFGFRQSAAPTRAAQEPSENFAPLQIPYGMETYGHDISERAHFAKGGHAKKHGDEKQDRALFKTMITAEEKKEGRIKKAAGGSVGDSRQINLSKSMSDSQGIKFDPDTGDGDYDAGPGSANILDAKLPPNPGIKKFAKGGAATDAQSAGGIPPAAKMSASGRVKKAIGGRMRVRLPRDMKAQALQPHSPINTPPRNPMQTRTPTGNASMPGGQMAYGMQPGGDESTPSPMGNMGAPAGMRKGGRSRA